MVRKRSTQGGESCASSAGLTSLMSSLLASNFGWERHRGLVSVQWAASLADQCCTPRLLVIVRQLHHHQTSNNFRFRSHQGSHSRSVGRKKNSAEGVASWRISNVTLCRHSGVGRRHQGVIEVETAWTLLLLLPTSMTCIFPWRVRDLQVQASCRRGAARAGAS